MRERKLLSNFFILSLLAAGFLSVFFAAPIFAHGGEDHGDQKTKTVSNQEGIISHTARAGEFEIMLKHAPIEPDTEISGKLFVTRYDNNKPFADAQPTIEITAADGKTFEASDVKPSTDGIYNFKLPPMPEGVYTILARINASGKSYTATFSGVEINHSHVISAAEDNSSWTQIALAVLAALVILGLFGGLIYFALRIVKSEKVREEALSA